MKKRLSYCLLLALILAVIPTLSQARGTRYFINWPTNHIGPVYVQIYDMQFTNPYEYVDNFKVWVTWDCQTKCYDVGTFGTFTLKFYKYEHCKGPMIITGNTSTFKIRYSLCPPWI
jgi:hypothetical protein